MSAGGSVGSDRLLRCLLDQLVVFPEALDDLDLRLLPCRRAVARGSRGLRAALSELAVALALAEVELALVHVAAMVDADTVAVPHVFEPLAVVLARWGDLLAEAVAHALDPLAIVDVLAILSFGAESSSVQANCIT